jgi:hypothetical protein
MTLGNGAVTTGSTKQKVNIRSSTEAELVGLDDYIAKVMWKRHFLDAQGYKVKDNIIYQDNKSTMQLAENGRPSIGKRSRHLNIKYFFVTDLINRKQVSIKYQILSYRRNGGRLHDKASHRNQIQTIPGLDHEPTSPSQPKSTGVCWDSIQLKRYN